MTDINQLAERHIIEHQSRLKHIDELLNRAREATAEASAPLEISEQLAVLKQQRDKLASHLDEMRLRTLDDWQSQEIEKAGPMGVWDAVAQQLEKLVERIER